MSSEAIMITPDERDAAEKQIADQSKRIDFYITEYSVEILANKMQSGEYIVPDYQREFTWEHERKSKFLESLIMGLPIPFIFFWEMEDGKLEIVDGSQRLRTIEEFLHKGLRLGELDQLTNVSYFTFDDLPESRQRKIRNRSIRGIVLNEHADEAARLDMFERINTGSKNANTAEIRRGALAGPFMRLVIDLAADARFADLAPMSAKRKKERGYEELVTRFFAYGDGLDKYRDRPADFIFDYVKKMNAVFRERPALAEEYNRRFQETMDFVEQIFPYGFRKTPTGKATPRARFEAIAIGSFRALQEKPQLREKRRDQLNVRSWLQSEEFLEVTGSDGANARSRLEGRINFVRDRLVRE
ncbi:DUF262 domain-containing protein [Streptomyces leeuwenhoekii]|jgi:hypothetical protein|uniref:GmrSD restriction endonucleases N-terminal domain-containing protein n=1 Tax=Streptomyces leeuwenhoekii TaxID=1437453 RepID=A0A0F7VX11_STRLW|nr:DUF262 domain-containing protein [Streptomyces leeuwenhoekii]CQR62898.1 Hypothetical [Streptomyces leeuwenhoekii]